VAIAWLNITALQLEGCGGVLVHLPCWTNLAGWPSSANAPGPLRPDPALQNSETVNDELSFLSFVIPPAGGTCWSGQ